MRLFGQVLQLLLLPLLWTSLGEAQRLIEQISFGHDKSISPNQLNVPGWRVSGDGHVPQLMSDRVILTPPAPGNKRGALWAENKPSFQEWTADVEFRATGPERGSGNLQIWYAKEGGARIGTSSIYTVGKFDGLVLVLDTYGSRGGSIRAFLNDGNTDFKSHHGVDGLAFAHCDYPYRNLGRPSKLQLKQSSNGFEVVVDGKDCFRSDKINLPQDYFFGISAASADTPDSFEVFKFLLTTPMDGNRGEYKRNPGSDQTQQQEQRHISTSAEDIKDALASEFTTPSSQFSDLHNRLQVMQHAMNGIFKEISHLSRASEERHSELAKRETVSPSQITALENRLASIERAVELVRRDVEGKDYKGQLDKLENALRDTHTSLTDVMPHIFNEIVSTSAPRMGFFVFVFIVFQLSLVGLYIWYKRRRAHAPKKYL